MKIFLSYRYTGEDLKVLEGILANICSNLESCGHNVFCSFGKNKFFVENNFSYKQILEYALKELDESDYILAFIKSQDKSEGMLLEIGYALAKGMKIILAIKKDVKTVFLPQIADQVIQFETLEDLYTQLKELVLK